MRILVHTDDLVAETMAGSAARAWELAKALENGGHQLRLAAAEGSEAPEADGPPVVKRPPWSWAEAVVAPAWSLPPRAFIGRRLLIADGTTPLLAELESMPQTPGILRRRRTAAARLPLVTARADAILTAGPAQVEWWSERVSGRFGLPFLKVAFGLPDSPPSAEIDQLADVPESWAVVLWWGGVWPWLDLDTLLAARARLGSARVSIVVPTATRPGGAAGSRFGRSELVRAMDRHGLKPPQVVALDRWIPYRERHRVLNRASLVAVLHRPGDEAALSFRTRALDGLWAGVPLLLSAGGEVSRLAREHGWGGVVPAGDDAAVAATIELLLGESEQTRCRRALAAGREAWRWSRIVEPLLDTLPSLPAVRRRPLLPAAFRAALTLGRRSARSSS